MTTALVALASMVVGAVLGALVLVAIVVVTVIAHDPDNDR